MNKNNHIWIGRCIVAVVTSLDDVRLRTMTFAQKIHLQKVKVKESGFQVHVNQFK